METKSTTVGTHGSCVHHERKSPRAKFHDYSGGDYFVTICTQDKKHCFGKILNGEMIFSELGKYCDVQLQELSKHYAYCEVPLYVVMPNHIHAIIVIHDDRTHGRDGNVGTHGSCVRNVATDTIKRTHEPCVPTVRTALSVVIGGLKRAVTMYARRNNIEFGWQSRYHDHIIRGTRDGNKIAEYIENNVARWDADCFNN